MCLVQRDMADCADPRQTDTGHEHDIECHIVFVNTASDWKHYKVGLFTVRMLAASFSTILMTHFTHRLNNHRLK
jgi:hypothetical protein